EQARVYEAGHGCNSIAIEEQHVQNDRLGRRTAVDAECNAAVGACGHEAVRTSAGRTSGPTEEVANRGAADVPLRQWWHAQNCVILEHGYEGLDVALLPGSNVALDESALSIRGQAGRVRRRGLVHPGPRPLNCAVGRLH